MHMLVIALVIALVVVLIYMIYLLDTPYHVQYGPTTYNVMDVYQGGSMPILIVHGGGLVKGSKENLREKNTAITFNKLGYTVYNMDYTIGPNSYPQNIADISLAINYINKANSAPLTVIGFSAGAMLVLLMAVKQLLPTVKNIVLFYAISDVLTRYYVYDTAKHKALDHRNGYLNSVLNTHMCVSCIGDIPHGPKSEPYCAKESNLHCTSNVWKDVSSLNLLRSTTVDKLPNVIILHGKQDSIVNFEQSTELKKELDRLSFPNHLIQIENGKHGFDLHNNLDGTPLSINNITEQIIDLIK